MPTGSPHRPSPCPALPAPWPGSVELQLCLVCVGCLQDLPTPEVLFLYLPCSALMAGARHLAQNLWGSRGELLPEELALTFIHQDMGSDTVVILMSSQLRYGMEELSTCTACLSAHMTSVSSLWEAPALGRHS